MSPEERYPIPRVEVDQQAIENAFAAIEDQYSGLDRTNMLAWLRRFLEEVHQSPFKVLGHPPARCASDPDLLRYTPDDHVPIGGLAYARVSDPLIHVYEITIRLPKAALAARAAEDAAAVKRAGDAAEKRNVRQKNVPKTGRLEAFKNTGFNKRKRP